MKAKIMPAVVVIIVLTAILSIGRAQQQQPGGSAVSITNIPHVIVDTNPTTAVTGPLTDTQLRASAVPTSLASLPALAAGANKIGIVYPYSSCGTTAFTIALQAMPTSSTAITSTTTCILGIDIANTSAGNINVTLTDNQGTPIVFLNARTFGPGETATYNWPNGRKFTSGIKVQASGAGITYAVEGIQ